MTGLNRRQFGTALGAAALLAPAIARGQDRPRVVVVGGGAGGATAAHHLARDGGLDVTLIGDAERFTSCFFSNIHLGGYRDFASITHGYDRLVAAGVRKLTGWAETVDRAAKTVVMADGTKVPYDRLVLSPGIEIAYETVPGYSEAAAEIAPHAWKAGAQTTLLKAKLDAIEDGQQIVMVAPPNPYRCPPGPYERASMMAHVLKAKGRSGCRIVILDAKESFSKQALFQEGWERHYPGMIEWYGPDVHGGIRAVDAAAGTVETDFDTFTGALLNIIPAQKAGAVAAAAGLVDDSGWCPVEADTMRSARDPDVFVIGDAAIAGDMPKSAYSANSQAKVAVMAIRADLLGARVFPARYANTCWSLIETGDGVKVGATYAPKDGRITTVESFISKTGEDAALRETNYRESVDWYAGIVADAFG